MRRDEIAVVEKQGNDQEIEVGPMTRHQNERMALRILRHFVETLSFDVGENSTYNRADYHGEYRKQCRVHPRCDFTVGLGRIPFCLLNRTPFLPSALFHRGLHTFIRHNLGKNSLGGTKGRTLNHLLPTIKVKQD